MNRIRLLKALDGIAGRFAAVLARRIPLRSRTADQISSILLIRPGGIGDAVLLVPASIAYGLFDTNSRLMYLLPC